METKYYDYYDDEESSTDEDCEEEFTDEHVLILDEEEFDRRYAIAKKLKDELYYEPGFIGIKNYPTIRLLNKIINSLDIIEYKDQIFSISNNVLFLMENAYLELFLVQGDNFKYTHVIKDIYNYCYV
jgi:hypothetical protein